MKELEKTKRISVASVLFILIILIGLLSYKRPKHIYAINPQHTLENIVSNDFLISLSELKSFDGIIIDVRSRFEFEKGHLEKAINIYAPEILNDEYSEVFDSLKKDKTSAILYGANPNDALGTYLILYQLGINNLKVLTAEINYEQNKLVSKNIEIEKTVADVNAFIAESIKKAAVKAVPKPVVKKAPPKKVIPKKKKKKMPTEGGC